MPNLDLGSLGTVDLSLGGLAQGAIDLVANSPLKLGSVSFRGMEIPERIAFGGRQHISRKTLIGGKRIIESLGTDPTDPAWSGRFQGAGAMARARAVDALKNAGLPVKLVYGGMSYTVVITEFLPIYERNYQIPYSITCQVVSQGKDKVGFLDKSLNDIVGKDTLSALGIGDLIGDTSLNNALSNVSTGLSVVGSLTGSKALGKMSGLVGSAQGVANLLTNTSNTSLQTTIFGVTGALTSAGVSVAKLSGAVTAATTLANSNAVGNLLSRAATNLGGS